MWQRTYSKVFSGIKPEEIWKIWTDINNWHTWNPAVEFCQLHQPFAVGSFFTLKPWHRPPVQIQLVALEKNRSFTDCTRFPGAKMYGKHEVEETKEGTQLTPTLTMTGPLGFLWRTLVAKKIVAKTPQKTAALVARARKNGN